MNERLLGLGIMVHEILGTIRVVNWLCRRATIFGRGRRSSRMRMREIGRIHWWVRMSGVERRREWKRHKMMGDGGSGGFVVV